MYRHLISVYLREGVSHTVQKAIDGRVQAKGASSANGCVCSLTSVR
jgi:hypothetical protein